MNTTTNKETIIEGNFSIVINKSGISVSLMFEGQTIEEVKLLNPKAVDVRELHDWSDVQTLFERFWAERGMKNYTAPTPFEREV